MLKVSILGGSGYAGGELIRLLLHHPQVELAQVTSRKFAGRPLSAAHPNLRKVTALTFVQPDELKECDVLFVALPNGESMHLMSDLAKKASKIIDLGADFRLHDATVWQDWYHTPHANPELLSNFTYGIAELHRDEISRARYVACGGCEATVSILALYPLIKNNLIDAKIIIDAKMSSSQGGMSHSLASHHPERAGAVRSYMPTGHRHTAEIIQELAAAGVGPVAEAGGDRQSQDESSDEGSSLDVAISATALDMVRGLLVTIHAVPRPGVTEKEVWQAYRQFYGSEPFMRIVKEQQGIYRFPEPKILQGSNYCDIGFELDKRSHRLVVVAAIDNLVKGTAGQAVQALNLMSGFEETAGLTFPGLHPI